MPGEEPGQKPPPKPKVYDLPAPEIPARIAIVVGPNPDVPPRSGAKQMLTLAVRNGWDAHLTFARGPYINADGSFNRVENSLALWARRDGMWARAWWLFNPTKGAYELASASHSSSASLVKSDELKAFLKK